jgi:predicted ATPase
VTFLFTDIEGSTRRWEREPEVMRDAVARHDRILRAAFEQHAGFVFATGGDGFAVAFARAADAVRAAVEAQLAMREADLPPVRMGVHTGEADERGGDYFGTAVNRAARLMAIAHGGQVVVSRPTSDIIAGFDLVDLGEHRLRDLTRPEHVFQVVATGLRAEFPPLRSVDPPTVAHTAGIVGAPEAFTSFVGREADVDRCLDALDSHRLVTLTAPGGMGKTRLAIEVAQRAQPVCGWFVDLVPATATSIVATLAATVGATDRPGQSLEDVVLVVLADKPALLVVDNCEHVLDAVARITERALRAAPELTVLATSREPLAIAGERVVAIGPLAFDTADDSPGVTLFVERAHDAGAIIADVDRTIVRDVVAGLDGIPLAIELAAARAATLGIDGIRAALADPLRLVAGGRRTEERHRSLRDVLDWSYSLLDDDERRVLRQLSVFHGAFTTNDTDAVLGGTAFETLDTVGRLAAKSLVVLVSSQAPATFRLLETVREYARDRLAAAGETDAVSERHAVWATGVGRELVTTLDTADAIDPRVAIVVDDLRAAQAWAEGNGDRARARDLARSLARLAYARRFTSEAEASYITASTLADTDVDAAADLFDAAHSAFALLRGEAGFALFLEAADRAERGGDGRRAALALALAAERHTRFQAEFTREPDFGELRDLLRRARSLAPNHDAAVDAQLAVTAAWLSAERPSTTLEGPSEEAVRLARRAADPVIESSALDALGASRWTQGRRVEAIAIYRDRVDLLERMRVHDPATGAEQMDILHMAADALLSIGDLAGALAQARRGAANPVAGGAMHVAARELVIALVLTGRFDEALDEAVVMRAVWERSGRPPAGWMAPAAYLVAFLYGLRDQDRDHHEWRALGDEVSPRAFAPMRSFAEMRLALHRGDLDRLAQELDSYLEHERTVDDVGNWVGYTAPLAVEALLALGRADAATRLTAVRAEQADQHWARASVLRSEARLRSDPAPLVAAVAAFEEIDARFEAASTRVLLGGDDARAGRAVLAELGCTPPARL